MLHKYPNDQRPLSQQAEAVDLGPSWGSSMRQNDLLCAQPPVGAEPVNAVQIESSLLLRSSGCLDFLWNRLRRGSCACRLAGPYRGAGSGSGLSEELACGV